ncbi:MAG TPA: ArsR family transcriptional regulator [Candidatus Atribacteria bacterium]|nr:ArsR family transcriptional regulator [Candidatus Atribacteria bacterium]
MHNNENLIEEMFSSKGRVRVLRMLIKNQELNISEIARKTRLSHTSVEEHLEKLCKTNIVTEKRFGRIRIFKFNENNPIAKIIKEMFNKIEEVLEETK